MGFGSVGGLLVDRHYVLEHLYVSVLGAGGRVTFSLLISRSSGGKWGHAWYHLGCH